MNVLSVFDGMSCGQIALIELGFKIDKYYAAEIDKPAITQTQHNFPNTIQLGSVTDVKAKDLEKIDLLIGGSPCQGFSFAGKQLNFDDPRSALFFEYVRLWKEIKAINPNAVFLLENVNMKKEYLRVISEYLGVFPVRINSNLVSAQNRDRWYWSNIKTKDVGLFAELWTDIPQPEDRCILLKDILETNVPDKYFLSDKMINYFKNRAANFNNGKVNVRDKNNKATTITASSSSIDISDNFVLDTTLNVKANQNKSNCFTAGGNSGGLHSDMDIVCVAMRGRNPENSSNRKTGSPTEQRLEPKTDGKTNCLTSVSKDNLIMTKNYLQLKGGFDSDNRFYKGDSKHAACLTKGADKTGYFDGYKLRRLTPIECSRLQTIPEWYEWIVSDTQIYRMLGNGWTVEVIKHIFSFLNGFEKTNVGGQKNNYGQTCSPLNRSTSPACC
jgi:DNA (cytosine-5)-methyltransferase 3A